MTNYLPAGAPEPQKSPWWIYLAVALMVISIPTGLIGFFMTWEGWWLGITAFGIILGLAG